MTLNSYNASHVGASEAGWIDVRHGDCLDLMQTLPDNSIDVVISDIPYGEVSQKSSGLRKLDRGKANSCDIDLVEMVDQSVRVCRGSLYIFCGTEQISSITSAFKAHKLTTRVGAWEKSNPSPMNGTRLWLSGMEFCVFARKPKATFNEHCKKAIWKYPVGRSKVHPTEKPLALMERLVQASSNIGDTVLDFTMGSGTTGVACQNLSRNFIGIELDRDYFDVAKQRMNIKE
jgi:site-specific DNA-methyltransferase (adenine-specific)